MADFFCTKRIRIVESLPTNLPAIESNELRLDHLFVLDDGSVAILDYESDFSRENFVKYINYVARILKRYASQGRLAQVSVIRVVVIYTADVEKAESVYDLGGMILQLEQAFLIHLDTEAILGKLGEKIGEGVPLTEEELMELMILPLTVKGKAAKQPYIERAVELAKQLPDRSQSLQALAGILTFSDKVIDRDYRDRIKEEMRMTQVGQMLIDEGIEKGIEKGIQALVQDYLENGSSDEKILEKLIRHFSLSREKAAMYLEKFRTSGKTDDPENN